MSRDKEEMERASVRGLADLGLKENWYEVCQDRKEWSKRCKQETDQVASCRKTIICAANSQPQERSLVCMWTDLQ